MLSYNDAVALLWTARLNLEVIFVSTADGDPYINLRARPWKNSAQDGFMLLVGAYLFEDALIEVADAYQHDKWLRLDWSRRYGPIASPEQTPRQFPTQPSLRALEKPQEPRFTPRGYQGVYDEDNGA